MTRKGLLERVTVDPTVCSGKPCVRGKSAEGMAPDEIIDHYPSPESDDIRAAVAYAADLARESVWKITA